MLMSIYMCIQIGDAFDYEQLCHCSRYHASIYLVIFQILTNLEVFIYTKIADAFEKGICHLITIL